MTFEVEIDQSLEAGQLMVHPILPLPRVILFSGTQDILWFVKTGLNYKRWLLSIFDYDIG